VKNYEFEGKYSIEECIERSSNCSEKGLDYLLRAKEYEKKGNSSLCNYYNNEAYREYKKELKWLEKASAMGSANAQYLIGMTYEGNGPLHSLGAAKDAYKRAAEMGYKGAKEKADSIKDKDIYMESMLCFTMVNIIVGFFACMFIYSMIEEIFHVTVNPLLLSKVTVGTFEVLAAIFFTDKIKNFRIGLLIFVGVVAIAAGIYIKLR
jgi:hypothetical protein